LKLNATLNTQHSTLNLEVQVEMVLGVAGDGERGNSVEIDRGIVGLYI
jgi:hypothetical protein